MKVLLWASAAVLAVAAGCTSFEYDGESFAPNEGRVIVFNITQAPNKSMWRTIGQAEISRPVRFSSEQGLIYSLRLEAGELGADAIHLQSIDNIHDGEAVEDAKGLPWSTRRTIKADLLRHIPIDDSASPESAQARSQAAPSDGTAPAADSAPSDGTAPAAAPDGSAPAAEAAPADQAE